MYIVKQNINGRDYFYIRKAVREGDKVQSKLVCYGGKTLEIAEEKLRGLKGEKISQKYDLTIEELANFCKAKGFIFRSSDIYGGFAGFWDFGPLGVELFNNIKQDWWNFFVRKNENIVGMEASVISHPRTWKASGHLESFSDVSVICKKCEQANKIDKAEIGKVRCDKCDGEYDVQGEFNLMFKTNVGAIEPVEAYLRGETAQAMFMDFKLIQQTSRMQLPFGIAQIGRCFRNEISPRDFLFRSREFHIGEFEFFIHPEEKVCNLLGNEQLGVNFKFLGEESQKSKSAELKDSTIAEILKKKKLGEWHAYWLAEQIRWFRSLGLDEIKIREHTKDELSHYSSATFDIDYAYPFGSMEVAGIANRGQFDLTQHQNESKEKMQIFDEKTGEKVIPRVIEPTFGMERVFLAILTKAYTKDSKRNDAVVLKIPAKLAPVKAAVFPIIKKPEYEEVALKIVNDLREDFEIAYDISGSIGRRYARNDEIGTPMCITIDEETPEDGSVTLRDRDTTHQVRVKISKLKDIVRKVVEGKSLLKLGKVVERRVKEK